MPESIRERFEPIGHMLDSMGLAMCLFDTEDRTLLWNDNFLRFFPEHEGEISIGEHYSENLRRFYRTRLGPDELPQLENYVAAGIERHRHQAQPFEFEHRGRRLRVASMPLQGIGRLRLWSQMGGMDIPHDLGSTPLPQPVDAHALLDHTPCGLMLCDRSGTILWVNAPLALRYGLASPQAALGHSLQDLLGHVWARAGQPHHPACMQGQQTLRERLRFSGAPFELTLPAKRCISVQARPFGPGLRLLTHTDISELQQQRLRLAQAEQIARESAAQLARESALLQATLEGMEQGIAMMDATGRVTYFNQRLLDLLELPRALLQQRPLLEDVIRYQRERGEFDGQPPAALAHLQPGPLQQAHPLVVRQRPNGRYIEVRSIPVPGGGLLRTYTDVTERHAHQQHIEHLASHDGLTGLLNRSKFMELLGAELALAQRTAQPFAVLYLDLDGFKPINDEHGHAAGDQVLVWVAHTLRHIARKSDFVARLGGDEFAVLQRGIHNPQQAATLAQRLAKALGQAPDLGWGSLALGASVGLALYPEHGHTPEALLACADQAMYLAKASARQSGSLTAPPRSRKRPPRSA